MTHLTFALYQWDEATHDVEHTARSSYWTTATVIAACGGATATGAWWLTTPPSTAWRIGGAVALGLLTLLLWRRALDVYTSHRLYVVVARRILAYRAQLVEHIARHGPLTRAELGARLDANGVEAEPCARSPVDAEDPYLKGQLQILAAEARVTLDERDGVTVYARA